MEKHTPPETIREVGIVISYMQEDIAEVKAIAKELSQSFASKESVEALNKTVVDVNERLKVVEKHLAEKPQEPLIPPQQQKTTIQAWWDSPSVKPLLAALATLATAAATILTIRANLGG